MEIDKFPTSVSEKLEFYVYRLVDPRNGETFYVGKGNGNRVFQHLQAAIKQNNDFDEDSDKLKTIRAIINSNLEVIHIIHRHGMDSNTALHVEAALIDAYQGITNEISGTGSNDFGPQNTKQIITRYLAPEAKFKDKCMLINVNRSSDETDLYTAVRYAWKLDKRRAEQADYVLAISQGVIIGVFKAEKWLEANKINFPDFPEANGRYGFIGEELFDNKRSEYVQKRVPDEYRKKGASNPIKYTYEYVK